MIFWIVRFINLYRQYIILALLIIASLLLISINESSSIKPIRKFSLVLLSVTKSFFSPLDEIFHVKSDNEKLSRENAELLIRNQMLIKYKLENDELKKLLNFIEQNPPSFVLSKVLVKMYDATGNKIVIDKGYENGINLNSTVLGYNGLLGKVTEVQKNHSIVSLINNTSVRISVRSLRNNTLGILAWDGQKFKVYNVNKSADVQIGDVFLTSDFSTIFPSDIPVVKVKSIALPEGLLFFDITAEPTVDIDNIRYVIVTTEEKIETSFIFQD